MKMPDNTVIKSILNDAKVLCIYLHGSRVYGCNNSDSDYDFIVVTEDKYKSDAVSGEGFDLSIFSRKEWEKEAEENSVDFMECMFLPDDIKLLEEYVPEYKINPKILRSSFSSKSSNSFVKCKKKLTVEKDFAPYTGKKSLFHSFRILHYGIQILKDKKITDYQAANDIYHEIMSIDSNEWQVFKDRYQQRYNNLKSQFRLAEKEWRDDND